MRFFGFFTEQAHAGGSPVSIYPRLTDAPSEEVTQTVAYLRSGAALMYSDRLVRDVIDAAHPIIGTLEILTDGDWIWPSDLAYYVERHGLRVPDEFLARMRSYDWRCPTVSDDERREALGTIPGLPAA